MKLISISWSSVPRLPGLRPTELGKILLDNPAGSLKGWRLALRGPQAYFISPPGWQADVSAARDAKGPQIVFGPLPLTDLVLEWKVEANEVDALLKQNRWDSPEFGFVPTPVTDGPSILAQIPPGQMGDA